MGDYPIASFGVENSNIIEKSCFTGFDGVPIFDVLVFLLKD